MNLICFYLIFLYTDSPKLLMGGSSYISCSDAKEEDSKFPDKIDLDADDDICKSHFHSVCYV